MNSPWSYEQIEVLITEYEKHNCLWEVKNPYYHNRGKRSEAIQKILEVVNKVKPNTTEEALTKKWVGIRNTYATERKKVLESNKKSGSGTEEKYEPSLKYYKLLEFLSDQITCRKSKTNIQNEEPIGVEIPEVEEGEYDVMPDGMLSPSSSTSTELNVSTNIPFRKKQKTDASAEAVSCLRDIAKATATLTNAKSTENETFGDYVVQAIDSLKSKKKQLILKREIMNLIYNAQYEELE